MPAAARLTDNHICPMHSTDATRTPHVGGPVIGPGIANVLIGGLPAAVTGDNAACVGSVDTIVAGSATVLVGGKPAARVGDATAHGGAIVAACATVLIGG
jgi:uncharacterized Zn-binding protein involved in type VI secretion